jgi:hypothetical protein
MISAAGYGTAFASATWRSHNAQRLEAGEGSRGFVTYLGMAAASEIGLQKMAKTHAVAYP